MLARAVVYSSLFISLLLVYLPARVLARSEIKPVLTTEPWQIAGLIVAGIALWRIFTFVFLGRGTPDPFFWGAARLTHRPDSPFLPARAQPKY